MVEALVYMFIGVCLLPINIYYHIQFIGSEYQGSVSLLEILILIAVWPIAFILGTFFAVLYILVCKFRFRVGKKW